MLSVGLSEKDSITKAEVLQALKVVEGSMSFASTNSDNDRFKPMFPDSKIVKSYRQSETKLKYQIQHGTAPYFKNQILDDI